jgi:protein TonB
VYDRDSRLALVLGCSVALHVLLITIADILRVTHPVIEVTQDIEVSMIDVPVPVPVAVPDPVVPEPAPVIVPVAPPPPATTAHVATHTPATTTEPPPPTTTTEPPDPSGGAPVVQMDDIAPTANGVPVAIGKPHDRVGRGGTGTGTGTGTGSGSGSDGPPAPMSVATIKTKAKPRGDYGYIDASRDYPPEARQLGIEGVIKVKLVVGVDGLVKTAVLLTKLGHGLDELAIARARTIQFDPARDTDDNQVASVVIWTFNMTLPK